VAKERITRRDFLKASLIGGAFLAGGKVFADSQKDRTFGVEIQNNYEISFKEACDLTRRFDKLGDKIGERKASVSKEDIALLAVEVIPNFEYEGMVTTARYPQVADFGLFMGGQSHNHVMGRSNCETYSVINMRYANPHSKMFESDSWKTVLIHELAHVQQGSACRPTAKSPPRVVGEEKGNRKRKNCGFGRDEPLCGDHLTFKTVLQPLRGSGTSRRHGGVTASQSTHRFHPRNIPVVAYPV